MRLLLTFFILITSAPAFAAGLGFNPFEKGSPTSATGAPAQGPSSTTPSAPKSAPGAIPVAPAKHDAQAPSKNQANKK